VSLVLALVAAGLLAYAAWHDLATRWVPNWLPVCVAAIGVPLRLADHTLVPALIIAVATFAVLFAGYIFNLIGGGDVKLWPATVLLVPAGLTQDMDFFLRVTLIGGAMGVVYLILSRCLPKPHAVAARRGALLRRVLRAELWRIRQRAPLPYAFAIAAGGIASFLPASLT
jgi:prepilin peptidase CpaA